MMGRSSFWRSFSCCAAARRPSEVKFSQATLVMTRQNPLWELTLCRFREFAREPEVIFWVFGFPVLLAVGLGIAFRDRPPEKIFVAVVSHPEAPSIVERLKRV